MPSASLLKSAVMTPVGRSLRSSMISQAPVQPRTMLSALPNPGTALIPHPTLHSSNKPQFPGHPRDPNPGTAMVHVPGHGRSSSSGPGTALIPHPTLFGKGGSSGMGGFGMMTGIAASAAVGGMTGGLYANRDGVSLSGAARGALGGAVMGAMGGVGLPAALKYARNNNNFMSTAGSFSSTVTATSNMMQSAPARAAFFGAGGLLGGAAMGGSNTRNKRRGFNANRGNQI